MNLDHHNPGTVKKAPRLQGENAALKREIHALKNRQKSMSARLSSLEFNAEMAPLQDTIGDITAFLKERLDGMSFVRKVLYSPLGGKRLKIIIIHDRDDEVAALKKTMPHMLQLHPTFPGVCFEYTHMHASRARHYHESGTRPIIYR